MRIDMKMVAGVACLGLSACTGSGGTGSTVLPGGASAEEFDAIEATNQDYIARINSGALTTTTPTGTATMTGYIGVGGLGDTGDTTAAGDLALNVDFDAGSVAGTADNFGLYSPDPADPTTSVKEGGVNGTLTVTGTTSGSGMTANATGRLTDGTTPADVALDLTGSFYDDAGTTLVHGDLTGTVADVSGSDVTDVTGNFYATN